MHFSIKFVEKHTVKFFYYLWNVKVYEFVGIFIIVDNPSNWKNSVCVYMYKFMGLQNHWQVVRVHVPIKSQSHYHNDDFTIPVRKA